VLLSNEAISREVVSEFLEEAEAALTADVPRLRADAQRVLRRYEGIPTRVDVFEILGLHGHEDTHTEFLAWLLDPAASHGLGDGPLRRFLALIDDRRTRELVRRQHPLTAWVQTQFELGDAGIPDMVVAVRGTPGVVIVLEAKIFAQLTKRADVDQTTRYADALERDGVVELVVRPVLPASEHGTSWETVLVFLHARPDQVAEPGRKEKKARYRAVSYSDVEEMMGELAREADTPPSVGALLQQFRTSLLSGSLGPWRSLQGVARLRRALLAQRTAATSFAESDDLREALRAFEGSHDG